MKIWHVVLYSCCYFWMSLDSSRAGTIRIREHDSKSLILIKHVHFTKLTKPIKFLSVLYSDPLESHFSIIAAIQLPIPISQNMPATEHSLPIC